MTKLANEIVEIINSRNEYMEKQAGLGNAVIRMAKRLNFNDTGLKPKNVDNSGWRVPNFLKRFWKKTQRMRTGEGDLIDAQRARLENNFYNQKERAMSELWKDTPEPYVSKMRKHTVKMDDIDRNYNNKMDDLFQKRLDYNYDKGYSPWNRSVFKGDMFVPRP